MSSDVMQVPPALWQTVQQLDGGSPWPPQQPAAIARCVAALRRHRLLPVAAQSSLPEPLASAVAVAQREDAPRIAAGVQAQAATTARLQALLPAADWLALKGLDYGRRLYRDPCLREMDDIDILVRPGMFAQVVATLAGAGFVRRAEAGPLEASFVDPQTGVIVDAYRVLTQPQRVAIDYYDLWAGAVAGDDGIRRPAPAHALACHALVMANMQFATHLRKYLDLWLLSRDEAVVRQAIDLAVYWRMRRAFYASMRLLGVAMPAQPPAPWRHALARLLSPREHRSMAWVLPRAPVVALPRRPLQLWRKFGLIDSREQRLHFIARHCFDAVCSRFARG